MVYLFLAIGFEMIEALTPVDLLRRAGIEVRTVAIGEKQKVKSSHDVKVKADIMLSEVDWDAADALILPGGMPGTKNLAECKLLMDKVCEKAAEGKLVAAICAAPALTLGELGLLEGKKATCFPGMEEHLKGACHTLETVAVDGNIITSRGMGTAIDFGLAIIEKLESKALADEIGKKIVYKL